MITDSDLLGDSGDVKPMQHNPLEQFILLAKGTRAAACCDLIKTVLEAPGVYVFAELIALPNLQEVIFFRINKHMKHNYCRELGFPFCIFVTAGEHTKCQISAYAGRVCPRHIQRLFG